MRAILLAAIVVLAVPAHAEMGEEAMAYCRERGGDFEQCRAEQKIGLSHVKRLSDWGTYKFVDGIEREDLAEPQAMHDAYLHCRDTYAPSLHAIGACLDGYLLSVEIP